MLQEAEQLWCPQIQILHEDVCCVIKTSFIERRTLAPKAISETVIFPQVLMEIAGESLEQLAGSAAPRQRVQQDAAAAELEPDEDEALQARLDAVRS